MNERIHHSDWVVSILTCSEGIIDCILRFMACKIPEQFSLCMFPLWNTILLKTVWNQFCNMSGYRGATCVCDKCSAPISAEFTNDWILWSLFLYVQLTEGSLPVSGFFVPFQALEMVTVLLSSLVHWMSLWFDSLQLRMESAAPFTASKSGSCFMTIRSKLQWCWMNYSYPREILEVIAVAASPWSWDKKFGCLAVFHIYDHSMPFNFYHPPISCSSLLFLGGGMGGL